MARQSSRLVLEDRIRRALEPFYDQFGQDAVQDAVRSVTQSRPKRRGRVKSSRGAPDIDLEYRGLLVLALVEVVMLAKGAINVKWACDWIAKNVTITVKEMRGGLMWERSLKKPEALRRIYYKARKGWREDRIYQVNLNFIYQHLIDAHCQYPGSRWRGFKLKGMPNHFDVSFSRHPTLLIKGIDKLQEIWEQAQSEK